MSGEIEYQPLSGWPMLFLVVLLVPVVFLGTVNTVALYGDGPGVVLMLTVGVIWFLLLCGFYIVEPNGSRVLLLFGQYKGTDKKAGFKWVNPFFSKRGVSLRARSLNGEKLKVNDLNGNPVEIAAIIVWQVSDTFSASFVVDNYTDYVTMQSETAVRHLASSYPYDGEDHQMSLMRNTDEVSGNLQQELTERLSRAGVTVLEARLSHLAYAPEIAGAMLRRQQATAVIAARQRIVEGAVSMVEMALERLEEYGKLELDEERKASMVSNLLVVLCSEHSAQPVLNTGTLYQ